MRLLLFNLATDLDDPILGFTTCWIAALAKRVEFIHVITMRAGRVEVPGNVRVYSVGKEKGYTKPRRTMEFYQLLWRVLRESQIDVCFSHMIPIFTVLAAPVLKARDIPIVTWYAHPSVTFSLKLAHIASIRMVTSVSTAYPYKQNKVIVIGQGIDTDLFSPSTMTMTDRPPSILCVGRLSPVKDHPTLLRACALLRSRGLSFQTILLGGPARFQDVSYVQFLHREVRRLGLQRTVRFEPPIPIINLPSWYRRCTVHVNLTPTGFGDKVVWEAAACGRPCVVANEGYKETLGQWTHHLLYRYKDSEDLANHLEWALSLEEGERQRIGYELRNQVVRSHSLERLLDRLLRLFMRLRGKKSIQDPPSQLNAKHSSLSEKESS